MGGSKTKVAGGGAARTTADDFSSYLTQGLNNGMFGGMNQTSGMSGAINNMIAGRPGDPNSLQSYFSLMRQNGNGGANLPGITNMYAPQQFQGFQFHQPQLGTPQGVGAANLPQINANFNPAQIQYNPDMSTMMNGFGSQANLQNVAGQGGISPYQQAIQQNMQRQQSQDIADLRARYGPMGGTPAAFAEGNYRAAANGQTAAAMGQIGAQEQSLGLQQRAQDLQNQQGNRGIDISQLGNLLNANSLGIQAANANNAFGLSAAQLAQQGQGMNASNMLTNQNLYNNSMASFMGLNNDAINQLNQLGLNQNQFGNQFNMNNAQNYAQFGQSAAGMNASNMLQNQGLQNQFALGSGNLGANLQGIQSQAQSNILDQLFGGYRQSQQIGTPQAQIYRTPSGFQQGLSAVTGLAGAALPFFTGGFGGGGGIMSMFGGGGGSNPSFMGLGANQLQGMNSMLPSFTPQSPWG